MRIHHLNCGTDCPLGGALYDGRSHGLHANIVCHCLLIETNEGLVLVDTGYGLKDVLRPHDGPNPRITRFMRGLLNIQLRAQDTAVRQVEALGFQASDVRHILLTHLDFDHAGGLEDFPNATVHVMEAEFSAATGPRRGFVARNRYRPRQFDEVKAWRRYAGPNGEPWFGFGAVRALDGLPPEILMVPLAGHTWGHAGIAIDTGNGWLLHAGDAYFYRGEVRQETRECTPALRAYQAIMEVDRQQRLANQARLRQLSLKQVDSVRIFCAHDAVEFEQNAARGAVSPLHKAG
ncbi:MBL fold metallo-hydrolase [Pedomonas mirosovicensis]|uniref:MBL fold metallo-hydrolase n=1 Tax=Pedomonas mirosovicensis TaxID=2908641 RepID=UPI00216772FD|nr:MBL fold metallo-hydrolase [Pedomonas mirosovicensis]MCH8685864.1 MBL fold metallo-hydrolase [Pedomonas mirosovicensis]